MLERFFASIEWWKLVPDPAIFASGAGSGETRNAAMRSTAGDCLLTYLSSPATVSVHLDAISASKMARAMWINPQTGDRSGAVKFHTTKKPSFSTPKGWPDALLLIEAKGTSM